MIGFSYRAYGNPAVGLQEFPGVTPRVVFPSFFGINSQDWPVRAGASGGATPSFSFGTFGTFDCNALHWRSLHTSTDTFSWADLDTTVNTAFASGKEVIYAVYGCPTFLASTGAAQAGPYGGLGEGAYPSNLAQLTAFCTALMQRYNSGGVRKIHAVQLFNEPDFTGTPAAGRFFWGTRPQYVDMLWTAYSALKAADPGIICLTPGTFSVSNATTGMDQWINQTGTVNPSVHGYDCFDAVATHPYHVRPNSTYGGFGGGFSGITLGGTKVFQALLSQYGKGSVKFYATEYGISGSASDQETIDFNAQPSEFKRLFIARLCCSAMLSGVDRLLLWGWGNASNLCGELASDPAGAILGWQQAYDNTVGKTLIGGGHFPDGRMSLIFSDGSSYTV